MKRFIKTNKLKLLSFLLILLCIQLSILIIYQLKNQTKLHPSTSEDISTSPSYENIDRERDYALQENINDKKKIFFRNKNALQEITLSFVGDCTLGIDSNYGYFNSLPYVLKKNNNDYSYFFKNVYNIIGNDDLTIANLETTFTSHNIRRDKKFTFKGPPDYANILTTGSVEAVNISNNHIMDFNKAGFNDTIKTLKYHDIHYFGEKNFYIYEKNGVKIAFLGYTCWSAPNNILQQIKEDITKYKEMGCIVVASFHWGIERDYYPNAVQKKIAHFCIDNGCDLVVGHHPHVVQGIENYKGKIICYSLGNFVFGGNKNPNDKDTFILQVKLKTKNFELESYSIRVVPCSISSVTNKNDYSPIPLEGAEKNRLLTRLNTLSKNFNIELFSDFQE